MGKPQNEISTRTILKEALDKSKAPCGSNICLYESEKDIWFTSQAAKTIAAIIIFVLPLFTWIVIEIFTIKARQDVTDAKMEVVQEIRADVKEIKSDMQQIKLDLVKDNRVAGVK